MRQSFFRGVCVTAAAVCLGFGLLPLITIRSVHAGMVGLALFGAALLPLALLWDGKRWIHTVTAPRSRYAPGVTLRNIQFTRTAPPVPLWWRRVRRVWAGALTAAVGAGAVLSGLMLWGAYFQPPQPERDYTVVVLGCQILGDKPSQMLRQRLDAALLYLRAHPEAPVVCSGGLDPKKALSEAAVMRLYLLEQGIAEERIFLEEASVSTQTNLTGSFAVVKARGLPTHAALATNDFHLLRAHFYAKRAGFTASISLPAPTTPGVLPGYWVREWFALGKAVLLD